MFDLLFVCKEERSLKFIVQLLDLLVDAEKNFLLAHYFDWLHAVCFFFRVRKLSDSGAQELARRLALALALLRIYKVCTTFLFTCGLFARFKWRAMFSFYTEQVVQRLSWELLRVITWIIACRISSTIINFWFPNHQWRSLFWKFMHLLLVWFFFFFCRSLLLKLEFLLLPKRLLIFIAL